MPIAVSSFNFAFVNHATGLAGTFFQSFKIYFMKQPILLVLGLYAYCGHAQPTVTTAIIPTFGDSLHYVWAGAADPLDGLTGAGQTWDFSSLASNQQQPDYYFKFLDPANTPHADRYPNAELAATTPDDNYIYYALSNGTLELVGAVAEVPNFGTAFSDYDNNETETVFPMDFGNSHSDTFDGTNSVGAFSSDFNGTWSAQVDGYGTLVLPIGTFTNVLRTKEERTFNLTGVPGESSTLWRYSTPDRSLWLLSIEQFDNGSPDLVFYASSPQVVTSSREVGPAGFSIFPNPVKAGQQVIFENGNGRTAEVVLSDFSGKIFSEKMLNDGKFELSPDLPPGLYFLKIKNSEGGFFTEKIIVQR